MIRASATRTSANPMNRLFYYLIAAFTMFVLDEPGHPVGYAIPGGFSVEQRGRDYLLSHPRQGKRGFLFHLQLLPAHQVRRESIRTRISLFFLFQEQTITPIERISGKRSETV